MVSSNNSSLALDEFNSGEAVQERIQAKPKLTLLVNQAFEPQMGSFLQEMPTKDYVVQISGRITVSF